eukprot:scaffold78641_cov74-Phaeocystis_antarctica.AAC.1
MCELALFTHFLVLARKSAVLSARRVRPPSTCSAASYALLIEAPERAAKHPGVLRRGCLAVGYI